MKPSPVAGRATNSQHWFEKHDGHNVEVSEMKDQHGKPIGLKDYKCLDCRKGFLTAAKPGDEPISGQGPFGNLQAEGFRISEHGKTMYFTGKAKLVIHPSAAGAAAGNP